MSKGQIGQVLMFILAGLVFILIISYGYKAINEFIGRQEQVALVDVQDDVRSAVESVKRQYGSRRKLELRVPSRFEGVCVVNVDACPAQVVLGAESNDFALDWIVDACRSRSANVFLVPRGLEFYVPDIVVDSPNYVCAANVGGRVTFGVEGLGRSARVVEWGGV